MMICNTKLFALQNGTDLNWEYLKYDQICKNSTYTYTFPDYIKHTKWVTFIWRWFYESVVDRICCCFFWEAKVYSIRDPGRINKTVIMWFFFPPLKLVLFCVSKVERKCTSPPLPFGRPTACQPQRGIWHITCIVNLPPAYLQNQQYILN